MGCLKSPYDSRDYQFSDLVTGIDRTEYQEEYIPEYEVEFFDQGQTSMCCACATAMSRYIHELTDSGNECQMSPMYIYGNRAESVVEDGIYEGEGMYLKDALKQLVHAGDCFYDTLPGFADYQRCKKMYYNTKTRADAEALPYRVSSYYAVKTQKEVMRAIMQTGSVLAAYMVTTGWYKTGSDGIITISGEEEGGHAILITGWKVIDGKKHWIILNSWGKEWGDSGYGYINADVKFMEAYCILDSVHEAKIKATE